MEVFQVTLQHRNVNSVTLQHRNVSYAKWGMIFCIPFVLGFLIFTLYPMVFTFIIGFTDLRGLGVTDYHMLDNPGENFKAVLADKNFIDSLKNTMMIWILNFVPQMLVALLLTSWLTSTSLRIRGQGAFKFLLYMPNIITAATIAMLFNAIFQYPRSPANEFLVNAGVFSEAYNFLQSEWFVRGLIAFIQFWMWYGQTMLVLIAGVMGISTSLFEAAEIDGANGFQIFFRVTLPNLRPIMAYTLITSLIGGFQMFDIPKMIMGVENNGPNNAARTVSVFIYQKAFSGRYIYNQAAAASIIVFIIIAILSGLLFYILRDKDAAMENRLRRVERRATRKEALA